jgi:hypothetical protein
MYRLKKMDHQYSSIQFVPDTSSLIIQDTISDVKSENTTRLLHNNIELCEKSNQLVISQENVSIQMFKMIQRMKTKQNKTAFIVVSLFPEMMNVFNSRLKHSTV